MILKRLFILMLLMGLVLNVHSQDDEEIGGYATFEENKCYPRVNVVPYDNDKDISNQITKLTKQISKEEKALQELEDKYYDQFGAMEKALANLQSQQSALSGLLG